MLGIDLETVRFAKPEYLWLLIVPGVLLVGWVWQLTARRRAASCHTQPTSNAAGAISSQRYPGSANRTVSKSIPST